MSRGRGARVDGVVLLDKPAGRSSNQALQRVRRIFDARKAGHTGTLDPFATGMLPVCLGEATKTSAFMLDAHKAYRATALLGVATATGDPEGEVLRREPPPAEDPGRLAEVLASFEGVAEQVPPMYSAIKHQGRPLYEWARRGVDIERKPRPVEIHGIHLLETDWPSVTFEVVCGKGTYIRTLAEDIAAEFGTVAHLTALRRLWVHPFEDAPMVTLDDLDAAVEAGRLRDHLLPADAGLAGWPVVRVSAEAAERLRHGNPVPWPEGGEGEVRIRGDDDRPLGVGLLGDGRLRPRRVFVAEDA